MRIMVTGATGFLGQHVMPLLLEAGHDIIALTRSIDQLNKFHPLVTAVHLDIESATYESIKRINKPDLLIHLAWDGLPNYTSPHHLHQEMPAHFRFIKLMVESGLKSVSVAGTCAEYGNLSGEIDESATCAGKNYYARAKIELHRRLRRLSQDIPFELTWLRLFYTYGPGQSDNSLLSQLQSAASRGDKIFNMSPGQQQRDYLPVEKMANYIVRLSLLRTGLGAVNVCSGKSIKILDLVYQYIHDHGLQIKPNPGYFPYPRDEAMAFWGSTAKLHSLVSPL